MTNILEEALYYSHVATASLLGIPGWEYRDIPNMLPEYWQLLKDFTNEDEIYVWIRSERIWPDGTKTMRGQVFISPQGLENLAKNSKEYYKDNVGHDE